MAECRNCDWKGNVRNLVEGTMCPECHSEDIDDLTDFEPDDDPEDDDSENIQCGTF